MPVTHEDIAIHDLTEQLLEVEASCRAYREIASVAIEQLSENRIALERAREQLQRAHDIIRDYISDRKTEADGAR